MSNKSLLLIDLGNSSLKWARSRDGEFSSVHSASYRATTVTTIAQEQWRGEPDPERVMVSSVASAAVEESLRQWLLEQWDCKPIFVKATSYALGVTNAYSTPSDLGVDRWLTLLAVHQQLSGSVCVVDCGTAITIDLITADGMHLGGMILPGFGMMQEMLLEQTAIAPVAIVESTDWLATDTAGAVAIGGVSAVVALVDCVLEQAQQRLHQLPQLILTGTDAGRLEEGLLHSGRVESDLVLHGLELLASSLENG